MFAAKDASARTGARFERRSGNLPGAAQRKTGSLARTSAPPRAARVAHLNQSAVKEKRCNDFEICNFLGRGHASGFHASRRKTVRSRRGEADSEVKEADGCGPARARLHHR